MSEHVLERAPAVEPSTRPPRAAVFKRGWALPALILALLMAGGALHWQRGTWKTQAGQVQTELTKTRAALKSAQAQEEAQSVAVDGAMVATLRADVPQSTIDLSYQLEELRKRFQLNRLAYQVEEPRLLPEPVAGRQLAARRVQVDLAAVQEGALLGLLLELPSRLHGVISYRSIEIERRLPVDDPLVNRLGTGERPDVMQARVEFEIGSIAGAAPPAVAASAPPVRTARLRAAR